MGRRLTKSQLRRKIKKSADPESYFWTSNGMVIRNMQELADAFERMEPHIFYNHVTEDRNDFSTWVYNVLNDKVLAATLGGIKTKEESQIATLKHIIRKLS